MDLNAILFPAPRCSYNYEKLQGKIIFVPKFNKGPRYYKDYLQKSSTSPFHNLNNGLCTTPNSALHVNNINDNFAINNPANLYAENFSNTNEKIIYDQNAYQKGSLHQQTYSCERNVNFARNNDRVNRTNNNNSKSYSNKKKHNADTLSTVYTTRKDLFQIDLEDTIDNKASSRFSGNFKVIRAKTKVNDNNIIATKSLLSPFNNNNQQNILNDMIKIIENEPFAESTNYSQSNSDNQVFTKPCMKVENKNNDNNNNNPKEKGSESIKIENISSEADEGIGHLPNNSYYNHYIDTIRKSQTDINQNLTSVHAIFNNGPIDQKLFNKDDDDDMNSSKQPIEEDININIQKKLSFSFEDSCVIEDTPKDSEIVVTLKKDFKFIKESMKQLNKGFNQSSKKMKPQIQLQFQFETTLRKAEQVNSNHHDEYFNDMSFDNDLLDENPIISSLATERFYSPQDIIQYNNIKSKILYHYDRNPFNMEPSIVFQEISNDNFENTIEFSKNNINNNKDQYQKSRTNKLEIATIGGHSRLDIEYYIPCLYLASQKPTNKILIYFHGNGEDINLALDLLSHINTNLNVNVVAMEYAGYGIYKGSASDQRILDDTIALYDFFVHKLKVNPTDLIIFGRSIGSGPATYLAYRRIIGALILMSAFTSIRAVIKDLAGKWTSYLVKERFNNLALISKITCPTFIVHGMKDSLISYRQAQKLRDACKGICELLLPKTMDHIEFNFSEDFTTPLSIFLKKIGMLPNNNNNGGENYQRGFQLPFYLYELPPRFV